jgi:HEAT repeat protein
MTTESFSHAEIEAADDRGERATLKWNEPRRELPERPSAVLDIDGLGLAGLRLRVESVLDRSCGPDEVADLERLGPEVGPVLIKILLRRDDGDSYCQRRAGAIAAVGHLGIGLALEPLRAVVTDRREDRALRAHAALAVGRIGTNEAVDILVKIVAVETDPTVRRTATRGLAESGNLRSVPALQRAMADDEDAGVRRQAAAAVASLERLHQTNLSDVKAPAVPRRRRPVRDVEAELRRAETAQRRKR